MRSPTIRPAYSSWPRYDHRLREVIGRLTETELELRPSPDRWPLWATIGHLACQRVFWLCEFAGAPGADTTPFTDAGHMCPGDDDLEHALGADALVAALESTFLIVDHCLDTWTQASLSEVIRREDYGPDWVHLRGEVIQRVFSHDVYHIAEVNEILGAAGLPLIAVWD